MSDSYCKGCRDAKEGCERCRPGRDERTRRQAIADAERAVLDAVRAMPDSEIDAYALSPFAKGAPWHEVAVAEFARRGLKP